MDKEKILERKEKFVNVNFKKMDLGDEIIVTPLRVIKEGESKFGTWKMLVMNIAGEEATGFAPTGYITDKFCKRLGKPFKVNRYFDKVKNKVFFGLEELAEEPLIDTEVKVIEALSKQNMLDNKETFMATLKKYIPTITEERCNYVWEKRK